MGVRWPHSHPSNSGSDAAPMKRGYIAKCVARAMVEQELTITEAAEIAGVHRTTLGRWLRG